MHPLMKLGAAVAAILVLSVVGLGLLRVVPGGVGGPPAATPTPVPTSTLVRTPSPPPIACEDDLPGCAGVLTPGTHRSKQFEPVVFYTTPVRPSPWRNVVDVEDIFKLDPPDPDDPYVLLWSRAAITHQADPCATSPDPERRNRAADWIEFLTTHPGLVATELTDVAMGSRTGQQVLLRVADGTEATCLSEGGSRSVNFLNQAVEGRASWYGLASDQRVLVTVVDVDDRTVVILSYGSAAPGEFDARLPPIRSLISTFRFGCGPTSGQGPCSLSQP